MPEQTNVAFRASEVQIEYIELLAPSGTFKIDSQLMTFRMWEDIYSPCINVEIGMNDSTDIPFFGPLVGEEILNMSFATKSTAGKKGDIAHINPGNLYLTEIKQRKIAKDRQQMYVLRFTSEQSIINHNTRISRSWKGKRIDQIVLDILEEYLDIDSQYEFHIESTRGLENVVIPNWKPFDAIDWLTKRAINKNGVPNFMYWETNGHLYFRSLDELVSQPTTRRFRLNPLTSDTTKLESAAAGVMELDDLKILNQFEVISNTDNGLYASKLITHDITKKKIEERVLGLQELYNGTVNHTDPFMPISQEETYYTVQDRYSFAPPFQPDRNKPTVENVQSYFDSSVTVYPKHDNMFGESAEEVYDNKVEDWLLKRNALMGTLNQIKLEITFPAISGLSVGHMVEILVPAPTKVIKTASGEIQNKEDLYDRILSGRYMITSLCHTINFLDKSTTNKYTMVAIITKDATGTPIPGGQVKDEKDK